jgi:tRNA G18 (ribose-2'-O)-methylase SpoU
MPLSPPIDETSDTVRALLAPLRNDFSVALYAFGNAFAAGAVIRTAHSFLVQEIFMVGTEPMYETASMGMEKFETVVRCADDGEFLARVGNRPLICFEREHAQRSVYAVDAFPPGAVFMFGSERFGIPPHILARAHEVLAIPMHGINNSLPVVVAAGIAMSEWSRRYYTGGRTR